jgi:hypothetical protein
MKLRKRLHPKQQFALIALGAGLSMGASDCTTAETTSSAPTTILETGVALGVSVQTSYEGEDSERTTHGTCIYNDSLGATPAVPYETENTFAGTAETPGGATIDTTDSSGTAGTSTECKIMIPEGQLYFSKLYINVAAPTSGVCQIVTFQPTQYKASSSATFVPPWSGTSASSIDCSGATSAPGVECYSGVAVDMVPSFPDYRAVWFRGIGGDYVEFTAESANTKARPSNRWSCNSLDAANEGTANYGGEAYVANSFRHYEIVCADKWLDPLYKINLVIEDEDTSSTGANHRDDWDSAL